MLEHDGQSQGTWMGGRSAVGDMVSGYSIEVLPRTAAKIDDFKALLPEGTRVYVANVEGTDFDDMILTARRLRGDGFAVMPHMPARLIDDARELETMLSRYRDEADVSEALLVGGGRSQPFGAYDNTMQMLDTGLYDKYGFKRLHVAGHPEGNPDIDGDGSFRRVDAALQWKQAFCDRTDAEMAIVTQFVFDADPVVRWAQRLKGMGVTLPIHVGVAGPAKLQTLIKFAMTCGVGPSIKVLKRRAMDLGKLLLPYEPTDVLTDLCRKVANTPDSPIAQVHFFPLGGIKSCAEWAGRQEAA
ncbi:methylenetetrahydrofolate reductase [Roseibium marinum]|uniref:Methylenetetrahydrofolate reductase (NADPH) n=1 Tax=Roseibium marinum TaxID=281252 RepID=A0A2S3UTK9_9HYPH|nr:5,10-methylenetetrahydrofolate reductase [Roseibium marinum]POF30900.1 methylenetetrahydrofolate reductase (NADPH) [Roseibium marinum]